MGYPYVIALCSLIAANCWSFIDGTNRETNRPDEAIQQLFYSGHKRVHCVSYLGLVIPNGIIANMWGPAEGSANDSMVLARSDLRPRLQAMNVHYGEELCVYGDKGYPRSTEIQVPYKGDNIPRWQRKVNKRMSRVRLAVEYGFLKVARDFAFCSYARTQPLTWMQNCKSYLVSSVLSNCLTCLYRHNLVSEMFRIDPPSLEFYLDSPNQ